MLVTVEEYAGLCGVSPATIEWMNTDPDDRPISFGHVELRPVFATQAAFAKLWGAADHAIRYQVRRGVIRLHHEKMLVEVHEGDVDWGLAYWDRVVAAANPKRWSWEDGRVFATIFAQGVERELIRLGHLPPEGLVEAQLQCTARSPDWRRRNPKPANGAEVDHGKGGAPEVDDEADAVAGVEALLAGFRASGLS